MAVDDTTEREDEPSARGHPHRLALRCVTSPHAASFVLPARAFELGRGADVDLSLPHARVSRRHARISPSGGDLEIHDLESTNGVFVDGRKVERTSLRVGSVVRIGDWVAVVEAIPENEGAVPAWTGDDGILGGRELGGAYVELRQVAPSMLPVVLEGATGTGKELFARALHVHSKRNGAFHAINCAALTPTLAEAELFGHRRGAFTGADRQHVGHLLAADKGTLFLDEVSELVPSAQAKLLRVLETREVMAVGDTRATVLDARVVCATQTPLLELVQRGTFRRDLAMRLAGATIRLPTLSERRADIPDLFRHFVAEFSHQLEPRLSPRLCEALCLAHWSGNVRELRLRAQRLAAQHPQVVDFGIKHLPELESPPERGAPSHTPQAPAVELDRFATALRETKGNVRAAATLAGVSRTRMYRLLRGRRPAELLERSNATEPESKS
jgi:transcriptional regulator of acetoin/glycerol metabolism